MPEYRSKPTECEAMRWAQDGWSNEHLGAENIVSWVNANGGEAIQGQARFCSHIEYGQPEHQCDGLVDFYPCDPETFERRWEQAD